MLNTSNELYPVVPACQLYPLNLFEQLPAEQSAMQHGWLETVWRAEECGVRAQGLCSTSVPILKAYGPGWAKRP